VPAAAAADNDGGCRRQQRAAKTTNDVIRRVSLPTRDVPASSRSSSSAKTHWLLAEESAAEIPTRENDDKPKKYKNVS